jgi:hypothetical protein
MTRTQFRTPTVGISSEWAGLSHMRSGQLATNELIHCGGASIGMYGYRSELGRVNTYYLGVVFGKPIFCDKLPPILVTYVSSCLNCYRNTLATM